MSYQDIVISALMDGIPDHDATAARAIFERLFEIIPREASAFRLALPMARFVLTQYVPDDIVDFCDALSSFCEAETAAFSEKQKLYSGLVYPYAEMAADASTKFLATYAARNAEQQDP